MYRREKKDDWIMRRDKKQEIEILAPAGSKESLEAAICAGADAVYMGGSRFGARAYAHNFNEEELLEAIDYVHVHGRKIYLTVNTLLKDSELEELYEYLLPYYERGLDAVIVQDLGVMDFIKTYFPDLAIHVSTQATVTGIYGAEFFKKRGAQRIVPARELSLEEVRRMKETSGLEIECFVHGALCYCYSGQCLMSSMIGGRSGNRGQCAQPCRLPYSAGNRKKQDIMSLKDLCTIDMIPELIRAGIDSFKIEGRMKQPEYVYTVVSMYRKYVDLYLQSPDSEFKVSESDRKILTGIYKRRGYTKGYYKQHNGKDMISFQRPKDEKEERLDIPEEKKKEKFNGKLILSKGESAKLYVSLGEYDILCEGMEVQEALKQPLDKVRIEKQMRKTGNTEFEFENLKIQMDEDIFLPMQALNELRREAIERLQSRILSSFRRECTTVYLPESCSMENTFDVSSEYDEPRLSVLVSDERHLYKVIGDRRIDTVYVDSGIAFSLKDKWRLKKENRQPGQKLILAMPYIFRHSDVKRFEGYYDEITEFFDGVMIRNLESYEWLLSQGYQGEISSDYNIYVFNKRSREILKEIGIGCFTASPELNYRELKELDIRGGSLIVYGYQPVMITANCIQKSTGTCRHEDGVLYLTDRYQKKFAVKNDCKCCYNIIYNSQPLMLLNQAEEVKSLYPAELRLDLFDESSGDMESVIEAYYQCFKEDRSADVPDIDYTKGHFKRGVK